MEGIIGDIGKITVFLLVFLAAILFTAKSTNKLANRLFAFFLLVTSIDFTGFFLEIPIQYTFLNAFKISSVLLQLPLYFLCVRAMCFHNFKLGKIHLLHSLPFFLFLLLFSVLGFSDELSLTYEIGAQLQYYLYITGVFYALTQYKKINLENYSLKGETYTWLWRTTSLFLFGNCVVLLRGVVTYFQQHEILFYLNLEITLFALCLICWFVLKTIRNPELFLRVDKNIPSPQKPILVEKEEHVEEVAHLAQYMTEHKPYLAEDVSLQHLAKQVGVPEKQLSFLINRVIGKHFFDYINEYRIEDAKTLLKERTDLTVQEIMYQVGFNSKSSFYTAFKKHTTQTPTVYRKSVS